MDDRVLKLKTEKEALALAANADRLGHPQLAQEARDKAAEFRAAGRSARKGEKTSSSESRAAARAGTDRRDGESLFINGVYEQVLEEIEAAQRADSSMVCYLQPYKPVLIRRLSESPPSEESPWKLYLSLTTSLALVSYEADIVYWRDKSTLSEAELHTLNAHFRTHQPQEGEVHLSTPEKVQGLNLLGILRLRRLDPRVVVSAFTKTSDDLPLGDRTRAGGWSYVIPPERPDDYAVVSESVWEEQARKEAEKSRKLPRAERLERLAAADPVPEVQFVLSKSFKRNHDVIQEVLERAQGHCEDCQSAAPFLRASDGTPYLEVHHVVTLANGGLDNVENAIALCPNCHRKRHFGM
jgi:5-methylcytosine-specific restriction endonuclease McrA